MAAKMRALLKGVSQCPHLPLWLFSVIRFWSCLPMDIFDTQSYLRSTGFPGCAGRWPASDRYAGKDIVTGGVGTRPAVGSLGARAAGPHQTGMLVRTLQRTGWEPASTRQERTSSARQAGGWTVHGRNGKRVQRAFKTFACQLALRHNRSQPIAHKPALLRQRHARQQQLVGADR